MYGPNVDVDEKFPLGCISFSVLLTEIFDDPRSADHACKYKGVPFTILGSQPEESQPIQIRLPTPQMLQCDKGSDR